LAAHITDTTGAHAASAISYGGGPNWLGGTTNPPTTVEGQLDKLINDLVTLGAALIYMEAGPSWADSTIVNGGSATTFVHDVIQDLSSAGAVKLGGNSILSNTEFGYGGITISAGTLRSQMVALMSAANHVHGALGSWADGAANPAGSLQTLLAGILSSLGGTAGAAKVGAAAVNGFSAGSVRSQLNEIAPGAVGTPYSAAKTFNGAAGDTNAALVTAAVPTVRKLLWEIAIDATRKVRFYARNSLDMGPDLSNAGLEVTVNARWNGTDWARDTGLSAVKFSFRADSISNIVIEQKVNTTVTWADLGGWDSPAIRLFGSNPSSIVSSIANSLSPKNLPKAWGTVYFATGSNPNPSDRPTDGFNITSMSTSGSDITVTWAQDFSDTNYVVFATSDNFTVNFETKLTGSCTLRLYDRATGALANASLSTFGLDVVAFGNQA